MFPNSVTISVVDNGIEIFAGEGKYKLIGHDSDEFPQVPVMENTNSLELAV